MEKLVPTSTELADLALRRGRAKKRNNAIVALLSGALPAARLTSYLPVNWERWLFGLLIGLVWANGFEYTYHRWLLHRPRSSLSRGHLEHHANVGTPEEAEHVSLGKSPPHIAILFFSNGIIVTLIDFLLGLGITPGILVGWTV